MNGWGGYALAFALFLLAHALPARPAWRARLVAGMGERRYLALYTLVSLALLYWLITAAGRAPYMPLWPMAPWQVWVPNLVMPLVFLLVALGLGIANPFSFGGDARLAFDPERPGVLRLTRHPLLLAIGLWAVAHMVPNGDLAHVLLFGGMALLAVLGMAMLDRRRRRQWGEARFALLARNTSSPATLPWRLPTGLPLGRAMLAALAYLLMLALHPHLFGVSPLPAF